ncbi:plasmid mobilization relaxosome protein MobC [Staphylococcus sp. GDY8P120P]|nr:plasmid mobilization relaxosome protein MobC [Staphylococcus sp. GDY8P120P]
MKPSKIDKSGAIEIAKQLRAIGNNVNQLTRRANASAGAIDSEELQAIKKELHAIWQQFS